MGKRINNAKWMEKYNRWQINVQKDGVRKTFYSSTPGRKGMMECHKKADQYLDDGINSSVKVSKLYEQWLADGSLTWCTDTRNQLRSIGTSWILPAIGHKKTDNITERDLQNIIDKAYAKGLAYVSVRNVRSCIKKFIKYGRSCNALRLVPENLTVPKDAYVKEKKIMQPDEVKRFLTADTYIYKGIECTCFFIHALRFQFVCGLRPGELLGIKNEDISGDVLSINRSVNVHGEITNGKNKNALRKIVLHSLATKILADQKAFLKAQGIISPFVFPNAQGFLPSERQIYEAWRRYSAHNHLTPSTLYELRHSFISLMKTMPMPLLKTVVGHSSSFDTLGTYGHEVTGERELAAKNIENLFESHINSGSVL